MESVDSAEDFVSAPRKHPFPTSISPPSAKKRKEQSVEASPLPIDKTSSDVSASMSKKAGMPGGGWQRSQSAPVVAKPLGSSDDFLSPKKESAVPSGSCCPICLEAWTNYGSHRVTSLCCGHLFGRNCLLRWIKERGKCPTCKSTAYKKDFRPIFTSRLVALDTAERDAAVEELQAVRKEAARAKDRLSIVLLDNSVLRRQVQTMAREIERYQHILHAHQDCGVVIQGGIEQPMMLPTRSISNPDALLQGQTHKFRVQGARVVDIGPFADQGVVSVAVPGERYGIQLMSLAQRSLSTSLVLHNGPIRDIRIGGDESSFVLTGGLDRKMILVNCTSHHIVHTWDVAAPVWSCAWGSSKLLVAAGMGNGHVVVHDIRKMDDILADVQAPTSQPLHSLVMTPTGMVGASMGGVYQWQQDNWKMDAITIEMPEERCISLSSTKDRSKWLASFRTEDERARHCVFSLDKGVMNEWDGPSPTTRMARSSICETKDQLLVAAVDEASCRVGLWNIVEGNDPSVVQWLDRHPSPPLDARCWVEEQGLLTLASTSEKLVHMTVAT